MSEPKYPSDAQDRFLVRMPEGMREQIANAAKANSRSMNSEIVARLQQTFVPDELKTAKQRGNELMSRDVRALHYEARLEESRCLLALLAARGEMDDAVRALETARNNGAKEIDQARLASELNARVTQVTDLKAALTAASLKANSTEADLRRIDPHYRPQ